MDSLKTVIVMQVRNVDVQDQSGGNGEREEGTNAYVTEVEGMEMGVREMLTSMFLTVIIGLMMILFMDQGVRVEEIGSKINMKCLWNILLCMRCPVSTQLDT